MMPPSILRALLISALLLTLAVPARATVTDYCTGAPNSVGPGADISWVGPHHPQFGGLAVTGCPPQTFGVFIYSLSTSQTPFGDGVLCVGAPNWILSRRYTDAQGSLLLRIWQGGDGKDLHWLTSPQNAGATWHFQYMYRDSGGPGGSGFNLTDGVAVTFWLIG